MSYVINFATMHDTSLLEKINDINAASVGRKLKVEDIEIVELSKLPSGAFSVELINREDLTDTVVVSHEKLDLADFLKHELADLTWWNPDNFDAARDTAAASLMFNNALIKAGIIAAKAWEVGSGQMSIVYDAPTAQYTMVFTCTSHVWKEYRFDLPRSFASVFNQQILPGFTAANV
ncbi:hypothetical protein pEaSNUABM38_00087 [Erwinia phage pEa_SNUABM_38]|nr:hypothetical protein pEaSNUABM38_00087 [Erwinia phage pEa_SNUABM_38]